MKERKGCVDCKIKAHCEHEEKKKKKAVEQKDDEKWGFKVKEEATQKIRILNSLKLSIQKWFDLI